MTTTRIILIRHGETLWNKERREMGQLDSPLSEMGHKQAAAIAHRLMQNRFSALYSSDLGRAMQTATYIAQICQKEIIAETDLRERNMGIFQGYTRQEMQEKFPKEWQAYQSENKFDYVIPQGESQRQRLNRSIRIMNTLAERHPAETIVAISHGGILRGFFEYVLGLPPGNERRFRRNNCTYNSFIKTQNAWQLETWGDHSHLLQI